MFGEEIGAWGGRAGPVLETGEGEPGVRVRRER
jgi:hypothetical protein